MTDLALPGRLESALDHLAAYGLAALVDDATGSTTRVAWSDAPEPALALSGTTWDEVGQVVHAHATARAAEGSWLQASGVAGGTPAGLFSPRVKGMSDTEVAQWYAARSAVLDTGGAPWLADVDLRLIGALGEPSYWSFDRKEPRPDHGASRWEMKTRNRGEEFVGNRLRLLASSVAARTPSAITAGLRGDTLVDEVGKGRPDSRTPTGLTSPGPVDNARAWCALWGLSLLAVTHSTTGPSRSGGHLGHHSQGHLFLPVMTVPWPVARLRSVLLSRHLGVVASAGADVRVPPTPVETMASWHWLRARGMSAVVRFEVYKSPNASAPEKWARDGRLITPEDERG
ncbi:hypothetical protein [Cellulomonas soli]